MKTSSLLEPSIKKTKDLVAQYLGQTAPKAGVDQRSPVKNAIISPGGKSGSFSTGWRSLHWWSLCHRAWRQGELGLGSFLCFKKYVFQQTVCWNKRFTKKKIDNLTGLGNTTCSFPGQLRSRSRGHIDQRNGGQAQERHRNPGRLCDLVKT